MLPLGLENRAEADGFLMREISAYQSLELEAGGLLRLHLGSETTVRVFGHRWETLSDVPIFMARVR